MNPTIKKSIAFLFTVFILFLMYFGAYRPLKKSQLYIQAMVALQSGKIKSVKDFTDKFNSALKFYSPIGQDEVVSYYTGGILANVINQQANPQVVEVLIKDVEQWIEPIVKKGKGFGYSQNLYNFAMIYELAAEKLKSAEYLQKSVDLFYEGLKNSPNRKLFLKGLFSVCQLTGDNEKLKEIGEIILRFWPEDREIKEALGKLGS